jgi:hypothetical protein
MIDLCAEDATTLYARSNTRFIPLRVGNAGEWLRAEVDKAERCRSSRRPQSQLLDLGSVSSHPKIKYAENPTSSEDSMFHIFNNMRGRGQALRELFLGYASLGISRIRLWVQSRQRADTKEMQIFDSHGTYISPYASGYSVV